MAFRLLGLLAVSLAARIAVAPVSADVLSIPATTSKEELELAACINKHQPAVTDLNAVPTTWHSAVAENASHYRVAGVWWSRRPFPPRASFPLTVVTQLSLGRLSQLEAMCATWAGPVSAAVLLGLSREEALKEAQEAQAAAGAGTAGTVGVQAGSGASAASGGGASGAGGGGGERAAEAEGAGDGGDFSGLGLLPGERRRVREVAAQLARVHALAEAAGPCQLDLMLVYEVYQSAKMAGLLYPVNVMRNLARLQARTPLIGAFDVDMMVGGGLAEELAGDPGAARELLRRVRGPNATGPGAPGPPSGPNGLPPDGRTAVVLPALTTHWHDADPRIEGPQALAEALVRSREGKAALRRQWRKGRLQRFNPLMDHHLATRTEQWLVTSQWYAVKFRHRYEPWVVLDRHGSPWHDVRFRGYGMNKIAHVMHLNASGYTFAVHPRGFLMHRPHKPTRAKMKHRRDTDTTGLKGRAYSLGNQVRHVLKHGVYVTALDGATQACRRELGWWAADWAGPGAAAGVGAGSGRVAGGAAEPGGGSAGGTGGQGGGGGGVAAGSVGGGGAAGGARAGVI
ncbi:hypothetical protein HYH03_002536 [Edaphochlamys debaryana]|uniref:Uncharacterized protein n=1 Tax=Edaphochlamys debaryana TaxID=47281 RepID=A0A835YJ78_9CHLO|nr:hypothetical protein HYH03_002536 [Edaphochlamys debaryana]|eukprot:KAG2499595.1 hypothetical protein HYH03_002536 [Edaphochlamys debaryana]